MVEQAAPEDGQDRYGIFFAFENFRFLSSFLPEAL